MTDRGPQTGAERLKCGAASANGSYLCALCKAAVGAYVRQSPKSEERAR